MSGPPVPLVLLGGGAPGRTVLQYVRRVNAVSPTFAVLGVLEDGRPDTAALTALGVPLLGPLSRLGELGVDRYVAAVGRPDERRRLVGSVPAGLPAAVIVDPSAAVGPAVDIGEGTVVMARCLLDPAVRVGRHVSLGIRVAAGHGVDVGDFCTIGAGTTLLGDAVIEEGVTVGVNATILEGVRVGARATVGAGAVVSRDVAPGTTVVGAPARPVGPPTGAGR